MKRAYLCIQQNKTQQKYQQISNTHTQKISKVKKTQIIKIIKIK